MISSVLYRSLAVVTQFARIRNLVRRSTDNARHPLPADSDLDFVFIPLGAVLIISSIRVQGMRQLLPNHAFHCSKPITPRTSSRATQFTNLRTKGKKQGAGHRKLENCAAPPICLLPICLHSQPFLVFSSISGHSRHFSSRAYADRELPQSGRSPIVFPGRIWNGPREAPRRVVTPLNL